MVIKTCKIFTTKTSNQTVISGIKTMKVIDFHLRQVSMQITVPFTVTVVENTTISYKVKLITLFLIRLVWDS